ncbi:MAG TPA: hypothetical protein PKN87_10765 [Syntrophomonadaceae bacterium]|nr:hypothetical protein [Syntrophomonadaceae bacterium]HPR94655.1 hypothetical protein [Syntrophomonadaceae bacterium]
MFDLFSALTRPFKIKRLKKEYKMLYGSSGMDAEQSLQRQMARLKNKQPGRSEEWYLEKIIYDLERDRGRHS